MGTMKIQISEITEKTEILTMKVTKAMSKSSITKSNGENIHSTLKRTPLVEENKEWCAWRTNATAKNPRTTAAIPRVTFTTDILSAVTTHSSCTPTEVVTPDTHSSKTTRNELHTPATTKGTQLVESESAYGAARTTSTHKSAAAAAAISAAEDKSTARTRGPVSSSQPTGVVTPREAPTGALASHVRLSFPARTRRQHADAVEATLAWGAGPLALRVLALVAALLVAAAPAPTAAARSLYKVALTQKGYIQYLRYQVDVPDLHDFTYCVWLRADNFTHPQPIFSYSRDESERLVRGWLEQSASGGVLVRMAVREVPVMTVLAGLRAHRWHHICQGWDAASARWALHLDGALVAGGHRPQVGRRSVPGGGDLAVGQEVTDADRGLDDGIEGEVFGFNMVVGGGAAAGARLARMGFSLCAEGLGSPAMPAGARLLVAWPYTPVRMFGGATVQQARPICGDF